MSTLNKTCVHTVDMSLPDHVVRRVIMSEYEQLREINVKRNLDLLTSTLGDVTTVRVRHSATEL